LLHRIVDELRITEPSQILQELDQRVREALKQDNLTNESTLDGMDIVLCAFHKNNPTIQYAGANRPLYVVRNGEVLIYNTDRYAIGGRYMPDKVFQTYELPTEPGDRLYLFTDGFVDQFGGPQRRKFTPKRLQQLLVELAAHPLAEQNDLIRKAFLEWMGETAQLDDVTLIGVQV
jgi:serine phosphatase RsbU (regulator of sigma subunit)